MTIAKPGTVPVWDTNTVNLVAPTGGHQANGYVASEVPTSSEMNGQFNLQGQWHNFANVVFTNGGGAVGQTDIGNPAEATVTPVALYRDYLGNVRSLVDHNGYRMGEVSEISEDWGCNASGASFGAVVGLSPMTVSLPMTAGQSISGTWSFSTISWAQTATGQLIIPLGGVVPLGALVTNIVFSYNRTTAGDNQVFALVHLSSGTSSILVGQTISAGTGNATLDLGSSSNTGHLPWQLTSSLDDYAISVNSTITTGFKLFSVKITYVMPPPAWSWFGTTSDVAGATAGDTIALTDPQSGFNHRGVKLSSTAVSAQAGGSILATAWETFHDANCAYVIEFMCKTGVVVGAGTRLFGLGVQYNNAGSFNRWVWFYTDNTFANWQLQVVGSATSNTDTGVAVAASTVYRMRLEIYGTSVNSSGNVKIRGYINGTKVAEVNVATLPAADLIHPYFKVGTNGTTGGPYDVTIGRVRRAWNHLLVNDNL